MQDSTAGSPISKVFCLCVTCAGVTTPCGGHDSAEHAHRVRMKLAYGRGASISATRAKSEPGEGGGCAMSQKTAPSSQVVQALKNARPCPIRQMHAFLMEQRPQPACTRARGQFAHFPLTRTLQQALMGEGSENRAKKNNNLNRDHQKKNCEFRLFRLEFTHSRWLY